MTKVNKRFQKEKKNDSNDDNTNIGEMQKLIEKIENKNLSEYLWKNVYITENFKNFCLSEKSQCSIIKNEIQDILNGYFDFTNIKETIHYKNKFLCASYIYTFPKSELKLLFIIYFSKDSNNEYEEILKFVDINYSRQIIYESFLEFIKENIKNENNSFLEFDRMGLMEKSNIFFYKIEINNKTKIYFPFPYNITEKSEKTKKIQLFDEIVEHKVDFSVWDLDFNYENILCKVNNLNDLRYNEIFNKNFLDFIPSKMEIDLINTNQNLILAGRPGTGKTFIILIKTILIYLNCLFEKAKLENNILNWENFTENYLNDNKNIKKTFDLKKEFKIIVTSLSQSLCLKAEELFSLAIKNLNLFEYKPNSLDYILKLNSFSDLKKFPSFLNFRKLIFMLDGSLNFQFFDRPINNELKKSEIDCDIKFYPFCKYDCNYSINSQEIGIKNFFYRSIDGRVRECIEINEDMFYEEFNQLIKNNNILNNKKISINSFEVYSQIISIIKGSLKSYLSYSNGITLEEYQKIGRKLALFNEEQRNEIYKYFILYEQWKEKNNYFDIQDYVNYLIRQVNIELVPNKIKLIDILLIDEIQDFSINQLYLMNLISRDIKILAGDTCQTISKTNVFRFCDLNNIYYTFNKIDKKINQPKSISINMNFRCQIPILKLAHSIFEIIFLFFPNTLDKVKLDFSTQLSGFKPSIIYDIQTFINKLSGSDSKENKQKFNFAFNHCFLCRNNKVCKELKNKYNIIFPSTIIEAKGLEFEVVVIYNFFKDSYDFIQKLWDKILRNITFIKKKNVNLNEIERELRESDISNDKIKMILNEFEYHIIPEYLLYKDDEEIHSLFNLCSELKELYVSITRAKTFLFFYEENTKLLNLFLDLIKEFNLINEDTEESINNAIQYLNEHLMEKNQLENIANNNYLNGNYKKSEYYYTILNNDEMRIKSEIYLKYEKIEKIKSSLKYDKVKFRKLNEEVLELINKVNFDEKELKGEIYLNLNDNKKAFDYFLEKKNKFKCGLIKQKEKQYEQAFKLFDEAKKYSNAIECLIEGEKYKKLFYYIKNISIYIDLEHFNKIYKSYCNQFLQLYDFKIDNKINENDFMFKNENMIMQFNNNSIPDKQFLENTNTEFSILLPEQISNNSMNIYKHFPKLITFGKNNEIGINSFMEKHFFPRGKIDDNKANISIAIEKKNEFYGGIFVNIKDEKKINKNDEECEILCKKYTDILEFIINYLKITQEKANNNEKILKFIENYTGQIKYINNTLHEIKKEDNKKEDNLEKLDNLLSIRVSYDDSLLIQKIEREFNFTDTSKKIIDIFIFKINIVYLLIQSLPSLYRHKLESKNIKVKYDKLLDLTLNILVKYSKLIPLPLNELSKCLKTVLILNGHFTTVFPLLNDREFLLYSAVLRKMKYFFKALLNNKITFDIKNNILYHQDTVYCLNSYLSILICRFFHYKLKLEQNKSSKNTEIYGKTIRDILINLQNYPKIYSMLYQVEKKNQQLEKYSELPNMNIRFNIIYYFEEYYNFLSRIDENNFTDKELLKYVEIGNTISLFIVLNGMNNINTKIIPGENKELYLDNFYQFFLKLIKLLELLKIKKKNDGL